MSDLMTRLRAADPNAGHHDDPTDRRALALLHAAINQPDLTPARPSRGPRLAIGGAAGLAAVAFSAFGLLVLGSSTPAIPDARAEAIAAAQSLPVATKGLVVTGWRMEYPDKSVLSEERMVLRFDGGDSEAIMTSRYRSRHGGKLNVSESNELVIGSHGFERIDGKWRRSDPVGPVSLPDGSTKFTESAKTRIDARRAMIDGLATREAVVSIAELLTDIRRTDRADGSTLITGTVPPSALGSPDAREAILRLTPELTPGKKGAQVTLDVGSEGRLRKLSITSVRPAMYLAQSIDDIEAESPAPILPVTYTYDYTRSGEAQTFAVPTIDDAAPSNEPLPMKTGPALKVTSGRVRRTTVLTDDADGSLISESWDDLRYSGDNTHMTSDYRSRSSAEGPVRHGFKSDVYQIGDRVYQLEGGRWVVHQAGEHCSGDKDSHMCTTYGIGPMAREIEARADSAAARTLTAALADVSRTPGADGTTLVEGTVPRDALLDVDVRDVLDQWSLNGDVEQLIGDVHVRLVLGADGAIDRSTVISHSEFPDYDKKSVKFVLTQDYTGFGEPQTIEAPDING